MKRFEYQIWYDLEFVGEPVLNQLNKRGKEGWEFFQIVQSEKHIEYWARREYHDRD